MLRNKCRACIYGAPSVYRVRGDMCVQRWKGLAPRSDRNSQSNGQKVGWGDGGGGTGAGKADCKEAQKNFLERWKSSISWLGCLLHQRTHLSGRQPIRLKCENSDVADLKKSKPKPQICIYVGGYSHPLSVLSSETCALLHYNVPQFAFSCHFCCSQSQHLQVCRAPVTTRMLKTSETVFGKETSQVFQKKTD